MSRKDFLALLLGILILVVPLYMKVFMKISPFSFPAGEKRTTEEDTSAAEASGEGEVTSETETVPESTGIYYQMGSFVVNIAHTEAQRFLKVVIVLELDEKGTSKELSRKTSLLRDAIITILSGKDFPEIEDAQGKNKLRKEIMDAANSKLETGKVINVYFEEFVAQ